MKRVASLLVVVALVGTMVVPVPASAKKKKALEGVVGTIHGRKFTATNVEGADDPCVNGIYKPNDGILVFAAIECRNKRRRQGTAVKKNYRTLVFACGNFDPTVNTLAPPYTMACSAAVYGETKTGRFGIPKSMTEWGSSIDFSNPTSPASSVMVRIDSFDGVNVKGAFFGVFDTAATPGAVPPVTITGEATFNFPFKIQ